MKKIWIIICAILLGFIAVIIDVGINSNTKKNDDRGKENLQSSQEPNNDKKMKKEQAQEDEIPEEVLLLEEGEYFIWKKYEGEEVDYVDEKTFHTLKEIYKEIDFYGEFKKGDEEVYDYYKKKYAKLLNGEAKIMDEDRTGYNGEEGCVLEQYGYDMEKLKYSKIYIFDMDEDGFPELCLTGSGTYVFKYIPDTDQFCLWWGNMRTSTTIAGSGKILDEYVRGYCTYYSFCQLKKNGNEESVTVFSIEIDEHTGEYSYFVSLPSYDDETKVPKLQKELKKQIDGGIKQKYYKFRVTEKQYNELTENYFKADKISWRETVDVSYFFPEMKRVYSSCFEFPDNMAYADEQTFEKLEEIYEDMDIYDEFSRGDQKAYEEYRKEYAELLSGRAAFTGDYGVEYKVVDYMEEKLGNTTKLYYFDMDEDNLPELYMEATYGNYVFKYNQDNGRHFLLWELDTGIRLLGRDKYRYEDITSYGSFYEYYDSYENEEGGGSNYSVEFGVKEPNGGKERLYLVSWPLYEEKNGKPKLTNMLKKQGYAVKLGRTKKYFYRLTKTQYEKITKKFFETDTFMLNVSVPLSYFLPDK